MITLYICIACLIVALLIQFGFIMSRAVRNSEINTQLKLTESTLKSSIKEVRELKGIKSYDTIHAYNIDATKVIERRGSNTKFYMDDEVVLSIPEGSYYSVDQ